MHAPIFKNKNFDTPVEALRGFCAIVVLLHHCLVFGKELNTGYNIRQIVGGYTGPGHLMVLLFFMISGYVIGLTYIPKKKFSVLNYLQKRLLRLYPIYLISIIVTIVLFRESTSSIISALTFTQGIFSGTLYHNSALWSLNHEVVYYLLVIPILKFRITQAYVYAIIFILLICVLFIFQAPAIVEGYLIGFLFWFTGYSLSTIKLKQQMAFETTSARKLPAVLLLMLSADTTNIFVPFFSAIKTLHSGSIFYLDNIIRFTDLSYYLYCFYALLVITNIKSKYIGALTIILYASSWGNIVLWATNGVLLTKTFFYIPTFFLLISSIALFFNRQTSFYVSRLSETGSVSFALYVIHVPLILAAGKIGFLDNSLLTYGIRVLFISMLSFIIAYLLEKVLQPRIKSLLTRSVFDNKKLFPRNA